MPEKKTTSTKKKNIKKEEGDAMATAKPAVETLDMNPDFHIKCLKVNGVDDEKWTKFIARIGDNIIEEFTDKEAPEVIKKYPTYAICKNCGKIFKKTKGIVAEDASGYVDLCGWCGENITTGEKCKKCGALIMGDIKTAKDTDNKFGPACFAELIKDKTHVCADCGAYIEDIERGLSEFRGAKYCAECFSRHTNVIRSYHNMKNSGHYNFHKDETGSTPMMGFELEIDSKNGKCNAGISAFKVSEMFDEGFLHFEHDGSLGSDGFEIISQPACVGYHISLEENYRNAMKYLLDQGYDKESARGGFHIHIDRNFLNTKDKILNFVVLVHRFKTGMRKFSRREEEGMRWCRLYNVPQSYSDLKTDERYYAVNLCNSNTVELRIMRSTLDYATFKATLKFVSRLAVLAATKTSEEIRAIRWSEVLGDDVDILAYWETVKNDGEE